MTKGYLEAIARDGIDAVISRKKDRIALLRKYETPEAIVDKEEKRLEELKAYKRAHKEG